MSGNWLALGAVAALAAAGAVRSGSRSTGVLVGHYTHEGRQINVSIEPYGEGTPSLWHVIERFESGGPEPEYAMTFGPIHHTKAPPPRVWGGYLFEAGAHRAAGRLIKHYSGVVLTPEPPRGSQSKDARVPAQVLAWRQSTPYQLIGWDRIPFSNKDFSVWVSFSGNMAKWRGSTAMASWETAEAWVRYYREGSYKRVDKSSTPSSKATVLYAPKWLKPDGNLASDIEITKTLGGVSLHSRDHEWPMASLPDDVQRRLRTILLGQRYGRDGARDALRDELCTEEVSGYERDLVIVEMHWVISEGRF